MSDRQSQPDKSTQEESSVQAHRNYVIPGCSVVVQCNNEALPIEDLLSIVFGIAGANPEAKVDFWIKVKD